MYLNSSHPSALLTLPDRPTGKIAIHMEEVQDSKFVVGLDLSAKKLEKKDFFGKVSPPKIVHHATASCPPFCPNIFIFYCMYICMHKCSQIHM